MIHTHETINRKLEFLTKIDSEIKNTRDYLQSMLPVNREKQIAIDKMTECLAWARLSIEHVKDGEK